MHMNSKNKKNKDLANDIKNILMDEYKENESYLRLSKLIEGLKFTN